MSLGVELHRLFIRFCVQFRGGAILRTTNYTMYINPSYRQLMPCSNSMLTTCERFINLVHFQEPELIDLESRFPSMRRGRVVPRSPPPEEDVKGDAFIAKSMKIQVITKKCYQIGDTRGGFVFFDNAGIVLGRNTTKTTYDLKDFDIVGPIHNDFLLERSGVAMNGGHVAMGNAIGLICSELSEYISRQAFSVII